MPLLAEYRSSLKLLEVEEIFDLVLYRPIAFVLVKGLARTTVTPNQVTLASMVFGLLGGITYAIGGARAYAAGAVLFFVYNVLDCSDGQLARLNHSGSPIGRILDGMADLVASVSAYVGIGLGFASLSPHPAAMWALTLLAGLGTAMQAALLDYYRNRFLDVMLERPPVLEQGLDEFRTEYDRLKAANEKPLERAVIRFYLWYSSVQGRLATGRRSPEAPAIDAKTFYARNKRLMRGWTSLGLTTQWTLLIACSFTNRVDLYLVGVGVVGSTLAVTLLVLQKRVDAQLATSHP
jgi:hypothetical protein